MGEVPVRVGFLGGLGEIGRNCAFIRQGDSILIVDCGLMFPNEEMPGVDLVLPDFSYLYENKDKVVGCVLTHGHEDHTGGLSYLLRELDLDVYGSQLTISFATNRVEEAGLMNRCRTHVVSDGDVLEIGPFLVEFIPVTHSVPSSFALAITTSQGVIFHTGDFKLDLTPFDSRRTDISRIGAIGESGVRLLLSDSTNAEESGYSDSETSVRPALETVFESNKGKRVVVACFASHIHRVSQVIEVAMSQGRKVFTLGRSMAKNVSLGVKQGMIDLKGSEILDIDKVSDYEDSEICVLSTGSQGEPFSALSLMASGDSKWMKVGDNDVVIISADVIPGNESAVGKVIDHLYRRGATVIHPGVAHVHASGHAKRSELLTMLTLTKPDSFVPVHGEFRHLVNHAKLAIASGVDPDKVLLAEDGDVILLDDYGVHYDSEVPAGYLYVDGVVGGVAHGVLRDRRVLSEEGIVVVSVAVDLGAKQILAEPEIATRGWVEQGDGEVITQLSKEVVEALNRALSTGSKDVDTLKKAIRTAVGKKISTLTKRKPMVIPVVTEI
ncbi:ribonuclease J [Ferrithrix thermotolerans]|uniref:ribonuclease J n=1 Tax=Ferrithrix thermotolerans TaxID=209649 RepID=UPI001FED1449|nr:ribonuclease J [Ferrithrix thermotolerans]